MCSNDVDTNNVDKMAASAQALSWYERFVSFSFYCCTTKFSYFSTGYLTSSVLLQSSMPCLRLDEAFISSTHNCFHTDLCDISPLRIRKSPLSPCVLAYHWYQVISNHNNSTHFLPSACMHALCASQHLYLHRAVAAAADTQAATDTGATNTGGSNNVSVSDYADIISSEEQEDYLLSYA